MKRVYLREFDEETRSFKALRLAHLASIPTSGDKIAIDIDGIGYIFKVYDVLYGDKGYTDVNIIRLSTTTDYETSKFHDIVVRQK